MRAGQQLVPNHDARRLVGGVAAPRECALLGIGTKFLVHADTNICQMLFGNFIEVHVENIVHIGIDRIDVDILGTSYITRASMKIWSQSPQR